LIHRPSFPELPFLLGRLYVLGARLEELDVFRIGVLEHFLASSHVGALDFFVH